MPTLHMFFRAKKLIVVSFVIVAVCLLTFVALKPDKYEARMSFLIRNGRADPLVSADPHQNSVQHGDVTEEDINSEVELLGSTELLQGVVKVCGLDQEFKGRFGSTEMAAVERATRKLRNNLTITPVRKSSLISLAYSSHNRDRSVAVLNELSKQYLQKHLNLHTAGTAASLFQDKSRNIAQQLQSVEAERSGFLDEHGYTLLPMQRELMLQQMLDVQKTRDEVDASLAETAARLHEVTDQQRKRDSRIVTQDRTSANQYSVERLNTMLAELRNRRTELATKFSPGDRLIAQTNQQIKDTEAALTQAQQIQSRDQTHDVNPLRQALDAEADRLRQARVGLISRRSNLNALLERQRKQAREMETASIHLLDLDRQAKRLEENLGLYQSKALTAGIADDLDAAKISNVVVAAPPIVPALPTQSPLNIFTGLLLALLVAPGIGLIWEMRSKKLYGPAAIETETGVPVLATLARAPLF